MSAKALMKFFTHSTAQTAVWVLMANGCGDVPAGMIGGWSVSKREAQRLLGQADPGVWALLRVEAPEKRLTLSASAVRRAVARGGCGLGAVG
jgi:hypothetical protein